MKHEISIEEFALLQAAKRLCDTWGVLNGAAVTCRGDVARGEAETALVEVIRLAYDCQNRSDPPHDAGT